MILTSTRFRRRPSRLAGQPFRLASEDSLPRAEDFGELSEAVEPAAGHRHHHLTAHDLPFQVRVGVVPSIPWGHASPVRLCWYWLVRA
jgi:hypothetical protein